MTIRLRELVMIEPVHPLEGGELHGLEMAPGITQADHLRLVVPG